LETCLHTERAQRKHIDAWLTEKFRVESQSWMKKWINLLRQIESNKESLTKVSFLLLFYFHFFFKVSKQKKIII